jgi:hypothetical protein
LTALAAAYERASQADAYRSTSPHSLHSPSVPDQVPTLSAAAYRIQFLLPGDSQYHPEWQWHQKVAVRNRYSQNFLGHPETVISYLPATFDDEIPRHFLVSLAHVDPKTSVAFAPKCQPLRDSFAPYYPDPQEHYPDQMAPCSSLAGASRALPLLSQA